MSLLADGTAIAQVQSLGGLVSAGNLGELALVSYTIRSQLLPSYVGQRGGSAFPNPFHGLQGMLIAERAMSFRLFWHLHFYHFTILHYTILSLNLHFDG
jgi:hypothetical protein